MPDAIQGIIDWRKAMSLPVSIAPSLLPERRQMLQMKLLEEELEEYHQAWLNEDLEACADALGDLIVVAVGAMCEHGFPVRRVMKEINRSNMSKLGEDGKPIFREDGKLLKGPNFFEPNLKRILGEYSD